MTLTQRICPSILAADFMQMGAAIDALVTAGCDYLHMDVMDGHMVPAVTFGAKMISDARHVFPGTMDAHLMVANPLQQAEEVARAGAEIVIFHLEMVEDLGLAIAAVRELGVRVGVAVDGPTLAIDVLQQHLSQLDVVLIATGKVGAAGQALQTDCLDKVRTIRTWLGGENINVMVDIGINQKTLPLARAAGANWFVVSSGIFNSPLGIAPAFEELTAMISASV